MFKLIQVTSGMVMTVQLSCIVPELWFMFFSLEPASCMVVMVRSISADRDKDVQRMIDTNACL